MCGLNSNLALLFVRVTFTEKSRDVGVRDLFLFLEATQILSIKLINLPPVCTLSLLLQAKWVARLSREYPTLAFHASITNSFGKGALISLLRQFGKVLYSWRMGCVSFVLCVVCCVCRLYCVVCCVLCRRLVASMWMHLFVTQFVIWSLIPHPLLKRLIKSFFQSLCPTFFSLAAAL